jgi:hypothetical protein
MQEVSPAVPRRHFVRVPRAVCVGEARALGERVESSKWRPMRAEERPEAIPRLPEDWRLYPARYL